MPGLTGAAPGTFAGHLPAVAASVPASLISPDAFSMAAPPASLVPASCGANPFGFECRLGDNRPRADLLVQATSAHGRSDLAAGGGGRVGASWSRVRDFATGWAGRAFLRRHVDNVWLEFDVDGPRPHEPSAFFGFRPAQRADELDADGWEGGRRASVVEALRLLYGGEPAPVASGMLARCLDALPTSAQVFQVGVMLSRPGEFVRLCLRLRSPQDAGRYLERVGWTGDESRLRAALGPVAALADYVCLDVDIGAAVLPNVGMECYVGSRDRWGPLLNRLVADGLCTPGKREGLLAYPGLVAQHQLPELWPPALTEASSVLGARSLSVLARWLHHVKIVHRPDVPAEAKAYLAAGYRWRARGQENQW